MALPDSLLTVAAHPSLPSGWRRRALIYRLLSRLPMHDRLFDEYRMHFGGLRDLDLRGRVDAVAEMLELLRAADIDVAGRDLLEIGSGWHPLLPVVLHGLGTRSIVMTDVAAHFRSAYLNQVVEFCLERSTELARIAQVPERCLVERWRPLLMHGREWRATWRAQGLEYRAPFALPAAVAPAKSFDLVFSIDCLNYIPPRALAAIMQQSAYSLRPNGFIAHSVSVYDDYTIHDRTIRPWNFLRFSAHDWRRIGNSRLHFQNRWRPRTYVDLVKRSGFTMRVERRVQLPLAPVASDAAALDAEFRFAPIEEIACSHFLFAAQLSAPPVG